MEKEKNMTEEMMNLASISQVTEETGEEEENLVIVFNKPYLFEGKEYTEVDLSGLKDLSGADMIEVNKYVERNSAKTVNIMPEVSMEFLFMMAAKASDLPVEFFMGMPAKQSLSIKRSVFGFLFGSD